MSSTSASNDIDIWAPTDDERKAFGDAWIEPNGSPSHKVLQVAMYKGFSDGRDVMVVRRVTHCAFYELVVGSGLVNRVWKPSYMVKLGGGRHALAAQMAKDIAEGFLDFQGGRL